MKKWQDGNNFFVTFDNITEMVRYCKTAPNGKNFTSSSSKDKDHSFTMTNNFEEAVSLITNGWEEGFVKLKENLKDRNVDEEIQNRRYTPKTDLEGFAPCVPHLLVGRPDTMCNAEMLPKKYKIIDIIINIGVSGGTDTDSIVKRGIVAINYVNQLEMAGYRCNIHIARCGVESPEKVFFLVKIKDSTETFSIKRMAFPLIHPSMNRRFMFRILESTDVSRDWNYGYGRTTDNHVEELFKLYKKTFVFPSLNTIGIYGTPVEYMTRVKEWNKHHEPTDE